jgi:non-ribosomal peptide synthase protein (TIGR01720 family)
MLINIKEVDEPEDSMLAISATISDIDKSLKQVPNNGIGWGLLNYLTPKEMGLSLMKQGKYEKSHSEMKQEPHPEINFNYLGEFDAYGKNMFKPASENIGSPVADRAAVIHDLDINAAIAEGQLQIIWNYNKKRFAEERIRKMVQDFSTQLESILGSIYS